MFFMLLKFKCERIIVAITVLTSPQNLVFLCLIDLVPVGRKFDTLFLFWILLDSLKGVFEVMSSRLSFFRVIIKLSIGVHQIIVILFVFSFWVLIRFEANIIILTVVFLFDLIAICVPWYIFDEYTIIRVNRNLIILNLIYQVRCLHLIIINKPTKNTLIRSLNHGLFKADIVEILRHIFIICTLWPVFIIYSLWFKGIIVIPLVAVLVLQLFDHLQFLLIYNEVFKLFSDSILNVFETKSDSLRHLGIKLGALITW